MIFFGPENLSRHSHIDWDTLDRRASRFLGLIVAEKDLGEMFAL